MPSVSSVEEAAADLRRRTRRDQVRIGADLDLADRLDRVLEHEAGDLTCIGRGGHPALGAGRRARRARPAALARPARRPHGRRLPRRALSGPRRHRFGTPRDLVLGVTLVLADGTVASAGGKVVKNVAGYDLGKLVCGSRGRLGLDRPRLAPPPSAACPARGRSSSSRPTGRRRVAALRRSQLVPSALDVLHPGRSPSCSRAARRRSRRRLDAARRSSAARGGRGRLGRGARSARPARGGCASRRASCRAAAATRRRRRPRRRGRRLRRTARSRLERAAEALAALHERIRRRSTRRGSSPRDPRARRGLRALRLLPADLPDLRALERGDGLAARPDLPHGGPPRRHDRAQPHGRRALRPLPRLHGVRDRMPLGVQYDPADRGDARRRRGASTRAIPATASDVCSSRAYPYPRRLRPALAMAPLGRPPAGRLGAMAEIAPPRRSRERPPTHARRRRARPRRAARRLRPARRLRRRQRGDGPRARRRGLGGRRAAPGLLRRALGTRGPRRGGGAPDRAPAPRLAGLPIAVNASGCGSHLKEHGVDARDLTELLDERPRGTLPRSAARRLPGLVPPPPRAAAAGRWRPILERIPRSRSSSRASRTSAAAAPGSTTSCSRTRPGSSATGRPHACSPPRRRARERQPGVPGAARPGAGAGEPAAAGPPPGRAARRLAARRALTDLSLRSCPSRRPRRPRPARARRAGPRPCRPPRSRAPQPSTRAAGRENWLQPAPERRDRERPSTPSARARAGGGPPRYGAARRARGASVRRFQRVDLPRRYPSAAGDTAASLQKSPISVSAGSHDEGRRYTERQVAFCCRVQGSFTTPWFRRVCGGSEGLAKEQGGFTLIESSPSSS